MVVIRPLFSQPYVVFVPLYLSLVSIFFGCPSSVIVAAPSRPFVCPFPFQKSGHLHLRHSLTSSVCSSRPVQPPPFRPVNYHFGCYFVAISATCPLLRLWLVSFRSHWPAVSVALATIWPPFGHSGCSDNSGRSAIRMLLAWPSFVVLLAVAMWLCVRRFPFVPPPSLSGCHGHHSVLSV